jgi:phage terminase large subunit-like protein
VGRRSNGLTRAQRNAAWIESHCRVPEGRLVGQPVRLRAFQRAILASIYDNPAGTRRAIISFGRKNAKTSLAAFLLLLHLCGPEARRNSQLFSAAQSRDQAAILFALAAKIVRMSPDLSQYVTVRDTAKQLACDEIGTLYRALSAEASTAYGLSPVFVVHDELGQVRGPRSELYDALETASAAQEQPLSIVISTQAPNDADLLSVLIDDAKTGADPRTVLCMFSAPDDADPFSDEAIRAANPAFDEFMNRDEVRQQAAEAQRMKSRQSAYLNLVLNQRVETRSPFVGRETWAANAGDPEPYNGAPVTLGLDLSSVQDLTALVAVWQGEAALQVRPFFWTPEQGLVDRARRDRTPYDQWVKDGLLLTTPGAAIDFDHVARQVLELCEEWSVEAMAFDRWRIDQFKGALTRQGAPDGFLELMKPFGQGFQSMAPALDAVERDLLAGRMAHGDHPVLTMCAANAVVLMDPSGNRKLDKAKSTGRIDGMVALVMARGTMTQAVEATGQSWWDSPSAVA